MLNQGQAESQQDTFLVPTFLGFGYFPSQTQLDLPDGKKRFRYRFVPTKLRRPQEGAMVAAINYAAEAGALGMDLKAEEIPPPSLEPATKLDHKGLAYFHTFPLYGDLFFDGKLFYWDQYWDGEEIYQLSSNGPVEMLTHALRAEPQHVWAQMCLEGYHELLRDRDPVLGPVAMAMQGNPSAGAPPKSKGSKDFATRDESEMVNYPQGLVKDVYVGIDDTWVEHFKANTPEGGTLLEGSMGLLRTDSEGFDWHPYYMLRYEGPCFLIPDLIDQIRGSGIERKNPGAILSIEPARAHFMPVVQFQKKANECGWRAAIISSKSLEDLNTDPMWFSWIENDVRKQLT